MDVVVIAGLGDGSRGAAGATPGGSCPGGDWCGDVVVDVDRDDSTAEAVAALGGLGAGVGKGWAMTGCRSNRILGVCGLSRTAALLGRRGRSSGGGGGRASRGLAARHFVCFWICRKVLLSIVCW